MKQVLSRILFLMVMAFVLTSCGHMPDEKMIEKGKAFEQKEQFSEAVAQYEKVAEVYPRSPQSADALYRAGLVYANALRNFPKAVTTLERVIREYPDSHIAPPCQFMIGFIYANSASDTSRARMAYQTFLETYPEHELVESVKWELQYLGKDINEIPALKSLSSESQN